MGFTASVRIDYKRKSCYRGWLSKTVKETSLSDFDMSIANPKLRKILKRALNDEYPTLEDLQTLYLAQGREILLIGLIADIIRERQVGNVITYVVNRNINFTNICSKKCMFCAYSVGPNSKIGYFDISVENFRKKIEETKPFKITEVCIQGGIHPKLNYEMYLKILDNLTAVDSSLHIHAFSPQEIFHAAKTGEIDIETVLIEFKRHGLGSLPGTAAEILNDDIRKTICPNKINTSKWIEIIELAHELRIPTTSTILFGHIENSNHWITHLSILKQIQERTGGFTEFIPLPFIAENTLLRKKASNSILNLTQLDYIKFYSIARLFLGEIIRNIQTSWVKLGFPLAELTLKAGCNDFGGTLFEENITRSAGGIFGQFTKPEKFQKSITQLQRRYCERGTLYNLLC
ncbi:MAG: 5-amino-6-(D-ribitylamino)uracil--L-tyrosine 4-hydroxyphenyl transferase CofH [Candidatus Hodarchaeota archaeon]